MAPTKNAMPINTSPIAATIKATRYPLPTALPRSTNPARKQKANDKAEAIRSKDFIAICSLCITKQALSSQTVSRELTQIKRHRGGETEGRQKGSLTHGKMTPE